MKTRWLLLIAVSLTSYVAGALTPVAFGQASKPPKYVSIGHMKVAAGEDGPYLGLESDVWKPIHKKLIASGVERSWTLYGVLNAGTDDPYNYVTVQEFDSLDQYYGVDFQKAFNEAHPSRTADSIMSQTLGARDMVAVHLLERIDHVD